MYRIHAITRFALILFILLPGVYFPHTPTASLPIPVTSRLVQPGERYIPDRVLFGPAPEIPETLKPVAVAIPGHTYPVVQQPAGQPAYVSLKPAVVTQFELATAAGSTIGLLAHNFLAGEAFGNVKQGQQIGLYYPHAIYRSYRVVQVLEYQALQPTSVYSDFINLAKPDVQLDSTQVFQQVYQQGDRLVLQTCIERFGNDSWGRLFVIAIPLRSMASVTWDGSMG
mgnify:CR=1 FL=1